jgi:hypothetical protein
MSGSSRPIPRAGPLGAASEAHAVVTRTTSAGTDAAVPLGGLQQGELLWVGRRRVARDQGRALINAEVAVLGHDP